jgi:spore maturation protein CgeB
MDVPESPKKKICRQPADWPCDALLAANLQALAEFDKSTAEQIAAVQVPDTVELVLAHDGAPTFRFRQPDGRRLWLGHTSTPRIAAQANRARLALDSGHLAMNGIGSGAEAWLILDILAPYQALFVLESEPLFLKLTLQLYNFSEALRIGRLVILLGSELEQLIRDFYRTHPGYNLISRSIAWSWLTEQQNRQFAQKITLVIDACADNIMADIQRLREQIKTRDSQTTLKQILEPMILNHQEKLRVANCTNTCSPIDYYASRDLIAGFRQLHAVTDWMALNRPDKTSQIAQLQRMMDFNPQLIILVDLLRGDIPAIPVSALCAIILRNPPTPWFDKEQNQKNRTGNHDFIFASQQKQIEQLQQAGFNKNRLALLPLAADDELFHPLQPEETNRQEAENPGRVCNLLHTLASDVVLIANRSSTNPADYQVTLSSHEKLWQAILEQIWNNSDSYHSGIAAKIFRQAQQCGVKISEEDIRSTFIEIIQKHLGDAVLCDAYCAALDQAGIDLKIWGLCPPHQKPADTTPEKWMQSPVKHRVAGTIQNGAKLNHLFNAAKIHLYISSTGRPDQHLFNGLAAGAFFLVKNHPDIRGEDHIGYYFDLNKEIVTFDSPKDLIRKIQYFLKHEEERKKIAQAAREKIATHHTCQKRARQILQTITARMS